MIYEGYAGSKPIIKCLFISKNFSFSRSHIKCPVVQIAKCLVMVSLFLRKAYQALAYYKLKDEKKLGGRESLGDRAF